MVPVGSDKVPGQRLADGVTSNVNNGDDGILLTDLLWVQTILQIPETHSQGGQKPNMHHQNCAVTTTCQHGFDIMIKV